MRQKAETNRSRIVAAANDLFYHQGFNQTSFAEVAQASGIPKGNFYYYFKSKDELLKAVIDMRLAQIHALLAECDRVSGGPRARLKGLVQILETQADDLIRYGCPMGTLNAELGKTQADMQARAAEMFDLFIDWASGQFHSLGKDGQARALALHLLAMLQGAALISNVYSDRCFLEDEMAFIRQWIDAL